jgi:hypothetical protein
MQYNIPKRREFSRVSENEMYFQQHTTPIPYVRLKHALNQVSVDGHF